MVKRLEGVDIVREAVVARSKSCLQAQKINVKGCTAVHAFATENGMLCAQARIVLVQEAEEQDRSQQDHSLFARWTAAALPVKGTWGVLAHE